MPGKLVSRMSKRECFTLSEKDTVKSASQKFHEKKIGCMPVIDGNKKVIGILSERDLSRFIYAEKFNLTLPVSELMSKTLVTCDLNTSVTELMDEMTEKKIRKMLSLIYATLRCLETRVFDPCRLRSLSQSWRGKTMYL